LQEVELVHLVQELAEVVLVVIEPLVMAQAHLEALQYLD